MPNSEDFIRLPTLPTWPQSIVIESQNGLSEIYYENKIWKTVHKSYLLEDARMKGEQSIFWKFQKHLEAYKEEVLVVGYNTFMPDTEMVVCRTPKVANEVINILTNLKNGYESRVRTAKERCPRKWHSLGSDNEVLEESCQSTREKISVEWIGNLEKHRASRTPFVDVESEDLENGYVELIASPEQEMFTFTQKTQLDVGVQADVILRNQMTQTDDHKLLDQFSSESLDVVEEVTKIDELVDGTHEAEEELDQEKIDSEHLIIDDQDLNYFKSFINIENRLHKISDVAWHPTRRGYVAVAYQSRSRSDSYEDLLSVKCKIKKTPLISKTYKPVNEDDVKINEPVFDIMHKKQKKAQYFDSSDASSEFSDHEKESEDEETDTGIKEVLPTPHVYRHDMEFEQMSVSTFSETKIPADHEIIIEDEWITKYLAIQKQSEEVPSEPSTQTSDDESEKSDQDTSSDESASEFSRNGSPILKTSLYDDDFSSDSSLCEDDWQVTDTDGCVLVWNCNNDLFPQLKLHNSHDTTVIKFCPHDGDILAGGSNSGQLILWKVHLETNSRPAREDSPIIREFLKNSPFCERNDKKYPSMFPAVVSERNVSHLYPITNLQWLHPSLKVSSNGRLTESVDGTRSKQIFTSSTDGSVKMWNLRAEEAHEKGNWNLELIYNTLVNDACLEKYSIPIRMFEIFTPSVRYACSAHTEDSIYSSVPELNSTFKPVLVLANGIGEVGVVRWGEKEADGAGVVVSEKCTHEWWAVCHDDAVTSMSKNYFFTNIILTTGGHIFSLWNIEYKKGPIWWQQYPENVSISGGVFTPFHPGVMYISRTDGHIDIWNINKQIHKPVREWKATGYSIRVLSVVTPPSPHYDIGIADSNGNFHILKNRYDTTWNEEDLLMVGQFFKHAEENRRQLARWNRTWREHSTVTDEYGFERKPRAKDSRKMSQRNTKMENDRSKSAKIETGDGTAKKIDFVDQLVRSEEFKTALNDILAKVTATREVDAYSKTKEEVLAEVRDTQMENLSADEIFEKYCDLH